MHGNQHKAVLGLITKCVNENKHDRFHWQVIVLTLKVNQVLIAMLGSALWIPFRIYIYIYIIFFSSNFVLFT